MQHRLALVALWPLAFATAAPLPHAGAAWISARRHALQASRESCALGHQGYIVELDTATAGVSSSGGMSRLEALINEATKPRARKTSAPIAISRHLAAISAVAAELDPDEVEALLQQPDIASITPDCIVQLPPVELLPGDLNTCTPQLIGHHMYVHDSQAPPARCRSRPSIPFSSFEKELRRH